MLITVKKESNSYGKPQNVMPVLFALTALILGLTASGCASTQTASSEVSATTQVSSSKPVRSSKTIMVRGGGDVPIAVTMSGNPEGRPILFVHGFMASTLNWEKQLNSSLGDTYHLIAVDIRGHGSSGKPTNKEAYTNTSFIAQDIAAAIEAAGAEKPLVVGWSYGGLFVMDYVRHFGTANIACFVFIDTVAGLLPPPPAKPDTPERLARIELSRSANIFTIKKWTDEFIDYWSAYKDLPKIEREMIELSAMLVPHYARRHLRDHPVENMDLAKTIDRKTLFLRGGASFSPKLEDSEKAAQLIAGSKVKSYPGFKSMLQWYNADQVNADIDRFYQSIEN